MIKYSVGLFFFLLTVAALSLGDEVPGVSVNDNSVTMPLKTFNEIILYIKDQNAKIGELQEEVDWHRAHEVKIENCVRKQVENHKLVLACFGDKEI